MKSSCRAAFIGVPLCCMALVCGCRSYPVRALPSTPLSEISAGQRIENVSLAALPCRTTQECKAVFNFPMTDKGHLPILLVVENDGSDTVEVVRSRIEFVSSSGDILSPIEASVVASGFGRNAMAEAIFFFGIFSYDNANKYNDAMVRDWQEQGLKEFQIIGPRRTTRKYLYFNVGKGASVDGSRLRIPVEWRDTRMRRTFEISLQEGP